MTDGAPAGENGLAGRVNRHPAACGTCGAVVPALGGRWARRGQGWVVQHIACAESGRPSVVTVRFGEDSTIIRNRNGTCIDAPCCGCCTGVRDLESEARGFD